MIDIPKRFPASFSIDELTEVATEQNWEFIDFNKVETDDTQSWNFAYQTPDGVMIIVSSKSPGGSDKPKGYVSAIGNRVHFTDYDVHESPLQRMSTVPGRQLNVGLPQTVTEKLDYTPSEPLSESQFNDLFNGTEWCTDSDTTVDWISSRPQSKQPLRETTLEDIKHAVTVMEAIHSDTESKRGAAE